MKRIGLGVVIAIAAVAASGVAAPAAGVGGVHHRHHLRLVAVPAHPKAGQKVRLYVTGMTRGGRYYVISGGDFGNGGFVADFACAKPLNPTHIYREPITRHYGHTFPDAGTYRVSLTISAPCSDVLDAHTVRSTVTVG